MKTLEILRLSEMGYPQTKIKDSVKCARSTVGEVLKAFSMNSFSYTTVRNILKNGQDLVASVN